jgi:hypothetical protein
MIGLPWQPGKPAATKGSLQRLNAMSLIGRSTAAAVTYRLSQRNIIGGFASKAFDHGIVVRGNIDDAAPNLVYSQALNNGAIT